MAHLKLEDMVVNLAQVLEKKYTDEEFLEVELYAVIQALFTSLRWTALKKAAEIIQDKELTESVLDLETEDHFSSKWLTRQEIVERIMYTSGFNEAVSADTLSGIEAMIDKRFDDYEGFVEVEDIGLIKAPNHPQYNIELAEPLRVRPNTFYARGLSANDEG